MANAWNESGDHDRLPERSASSSGIDRADLWGETDAPPEENELRVIDLLKRLESASDTGAAPAVERTKPQPTKWAQWDPEVTCSACQYLNPADQKFCGYCGTSLQTAAAAPAVAKKTNPEGPRVQELREEETRLQSEALRAQQTREQEAREKEARELELQTRELEIQQRIARERAERSRLEAERPEPEPAFIFDEIADEKPQVAQASMFSQFAPQINDTDDVELEFLRNKALGAPEPNRSWRIPVAAAVLAMVGFVGYRLYNGLGIVPEQLSAALHPAKEAAPQPGPSDQTPVADSDSSASETVQEPSASLPATPKAGAVAKAKAPSAPLRGEDHAAVTPATQRSRENAASPVPSPTGAIGGREELTQAQHYLAPATRNSAEAAKWLWKAVGKENPRAVLLLSDLYVNGDGVAKSCDQARLLLTVAAKKGNSDAGSRLSSLDSCQ
ncbi:MAG TPA: hypothetical protein VH088_08845 [Terriglobales bacterium]|nr:hypothetical protein [Terriglobales bacterium]